MATTLSGGTTTSFNNTPQAGDDCWRRDEDSSLGVFYLDVMLNDLGGKAKVLWSLDDGTATDLYTQDGGRVESMSNDESDLGATIWITSDGKIGYNPADILSQIQGLAVGETLCDSFVYAIRLASGTLSWATARITFVGTNDGVTITSATAAGTVVEDVTAAVSGTIAFNDVDVSDSHSATFVAGANATALGSFSLDPVSEAADASNGSVGWTYTIDNAAAQYLAAGQSVVETYIVTIDDGHGGTISHTVTVTITGTNDDPKLEVLAGDSDGAAFIEGDAGLSASGTLTVTDVDTTDEVDSVVSGVSVTGNAGGLVEGDLLAMLTLSGDIDLAADTGDSNNIGWSFDSGSEAFNFLADGQALTLEYTVTSSDGHGGSDTQTVTITVTGTNDGPVANADTASGHENEVLLVDVLANDTDVDDGAVLTVVSASAPAGEGVASVVGNQVQFDPGTDFDHLADGASVEVEVSYTIEDEHGASSSSTVTITVTGTNDAPALTAAQATLTGGTEDTTYIVSSAALLQGFTDVDDGAVLSVFGLTATHGSVIDNGNGTYTITPNANYNGVVTLNYSVIDGLGGTAPGTLTFNLAAVNDPAVIGGTTTGSVTEATPADAGIPIASGTLTAADVDNPPNTFVVVASTATATGYGSYTMSAAGVWTYTLNNANATVNALAAGFFLLDSFTVQSADGTMQTITVTINGANDVIVVTPPPTETGADPNDFDTLVGTGAVNNGANINGSGGDDNITGGAGDQSIIGNNGSDTIFGGGGVDIINGNNGNDVLYGQTGDDNISGNNGDDGIYGGSGNDSLTGGGDNDTIYGGSGTDTITGLGGNDILIGGYGADSLDGGGGDDTFKYLDVKDTHDTILDFMDSGSDFIDLSSIDANPSTGANDAFAWGGTTPTANGAWYSEGGGNTVLYADTDGNAATAEFMVTLQGFTDWGTSYDQAIEGPPPGVIL